MHIKITFLGTGTSQGIPVIASKHPVCLSDDEHDKRLRVSILVEWENFTYVVDCGPDFRQQMLRANVSKINGVLFTHIHSDHTAGLDDLRPFSAQLGAVPVYAKNDVLTNLARRFDYIFNEEDKYIGAPSVQQNEITNEPFFIQNLKVIPIDVNHGNLQIFGYRFHNIAYLTDVKSISAQEKLKLQNLDVLIINALRLETHPTHLSLAEAIALSQELKAKKTYFTHISVRLGFNAVVQKTLPKNMFLAYDGLVLEV